MRVSHDWQYRLAMVFALAKYLIFEKQLNLCLIEEQADKGVQEAIDYVNTTLLR